MVGNKIYPFKGRVINFDKDVKVYRCLNRKGHVYSILQKGLVVAHTDCLTMSNVKMKVSEKSRQRVLKEKSKNVHAFIVGKISTNGIMGTTAENDEQNVSSSLPANIKYNPYKFGFFFCDNLIEKEFEVKGAMGLIINKHGVNASYCY